LAAWTSRSSDALEVGLDVAMRLEELKCRLPDGHGVKFAIVLFGSELRLEAGLLSPKAAIGGIR